MKYFDQPTIWFLLEKVHNAKNVLEFHSFKEYDTESIKEFINSVISLSDRVLYPSFKEMDEEPAVFENGKIKVHHAVKEYLEKAGDLGLIAAIINAEHGGLQLPSIYYNAAVFILESANNHLPGYGGLTAGAANLIATFGNRELKDTYLQKMMAGHWTGTMCMTEPQAGSSLSDITTKATPQEDGSYQLEGQKIFISGGDNDFSENIIHLVLARIKGAPAGTKGISLFVVPKNIQTSDGFKNNGVETLADFQKLGQRGYCTVHLGFGSNGICKGWIVGEPNMGLTYMFQMMNEARIAVGRGAVSIASAAYHASLDYAKIRAQGRRLSSSGKKDVSEEQTLIINHPDVRRMLFFQKAIVEGSLSLIFQTSYYEDCLHNAEGEEKEHYHLLLEILTPITKTYPSEKGQESVNTGLQVLGGYGFCSDFILQQYYRDIRISSLYEGTTGIQSLDLLGRKITMNDGKAFQLLIAEIQITIERARQIDATIKYAEILAEKIDVIQQTLKVLLARARDGNHEYFLANATLFMQLMGTLVIGWQWLKIGCVCENESNFEKSKIETMKYFFVHEIPSIDSLSNTLINDEGITILNPSMEF